MIYSIENEVLKISVKKFGCELTSVKSKSSSYEYLWQGNPDIWSGQSPILFPIIGRLIEDKYTLNGKVYEMEKHGFARRNDWELIGKEDNSLSFRLSENEKTLKCYPYCFDLIVKFILDGNRLTVEHRIINKNDGVMYFSIGAHPAFNCEIGDKLIFDRDETLETIKIDLVNSLRLPETTPLLKNEREITITEDIFKEDALIFEGVKSDNITLISQSSERKISFNLGNAPYLGIWAKPGAPYVCIEPWCGVNDSTEKKADFSQKDAINSVNANDSFTFTWYAEFKE
ncbi:MAG: aldose 1-epimerase family protein [Acutalibacteraceae bacterium]|nr:aldose 1-epimerase family protein [Acutalibacteraceae bacterium]